MYYVCSVGGSLCALYKQALLHNFTCFEIVPDFPSKEISVYNDNSILIDYMADAYAGQYMHAIIGGITDDIAIILSLQGVKLLCIGDDIETRALYYGDRIILNGLTINVADAIKRFINE